MLHCKVSLLKAEPKKAKKKMRKNWPFRIIRPRYFPQILSYFPVAAFGELLTVWESLLSGDDYVPGVAIVRGSLL